MLVHQKNVSKKTYRPTIIFLILAIFTGLTVPLFASPPHWPMSVYHIQTESNEELFNPHPSRFVKKMPDLSGITIMMRKQRFIQTVLPLILYANDEILNERKAIFEAIHRDDLVVVEALAKKYRLNTDNISTDNLVNRLLIRVAPIPVPIALAQAATESGWGQSRFAQEGNALFGQWVWNDKKGIKANNPSDPKASVRMFPDLLSSVRSYMLNLNSHYAYDDFRQVRQAYSLKQTSLFNLINHLSAYSQRREAYAEDLKLVIRHNKFDRFTQFSAEAETYRVKN